MQRPLILLPALAVLCYGAALPQSLVTGTDTLTAPASLWTFVIPCEEADCIPQTVTLYGRDTDATSAAGLPSYTIGLGLPTQTEEFGQGTTQTGTILPRDPKPQSLGSVTRSETYWPWPWPTVTTETETITVTVTDIATSEPVTSEPSSSTEVISRSSTFYRRQELGSPTRSVGESPTPTPTTSSKKLSWSLKPSGYTKTSHTTSKTIWPRQELGSPTRTVDVWPPWLWPTETTVTEIITETYTIYSTSTLVTPPSDITSLNVPRQALGSPTRSVDIWPSWWPTPAVSTITEIITETTTIYTSSTHTHTPSTSNPLTSTSITTTPTSHIIPSPVQTGSNHPITPEITPVETLTARQELGVGPISHSVTIGDQVTQTGTILPRQELIGTPSESVDWYGWGTGALPSETTVLEVPKEKRQVLLQPTRSFTSDGSTPSAWFA